MTTLDNTSSISTVIGHAIRTSIHEDRIVDLPPGITAADVFCSIPDDLGYEDDDGHVVWGMTVDGSTWTLRLAGE